MTNRKVLKEIEEVGGLVEAMESGWLDELIHKMAFKQQKAVEEKERIIVGQNEFRISEEEESVPEVHRVSPEISEKKAAEVRELREQRDSSRVKQALERIAQEVRDALQSSGLRFCF